MGSRSEEKQPAFINARKRGFSFASDGLRRWFGFLHQSKNEKKRTKYNRGQCSASQYGCNLGNGLNLELLFNKFLFYFQKVLSDCYSAVLG